MTVQLTTSFAALRSAIVLVLVSAVMAGPALSEGSGKLFINEAVFDAGKVVEGATVSHTFDLENKGEEPLQILRALPDCGCTTVKFDKAVLPGQTGRLTASFNTLNEVGRQTKRIVLVTSDPKSPRSEVRIQATVAAMISVRPNRVFFSGLTGSLLEKRIEISAGDNPPLGLKVKELMLPKGIQMDLKAKKGGYTALFTNKSPDAGLLRGRVIFETNRPEKPVVTIPVFARIYDPVEVVPSRIQFGKIRLTDLEKSNADLFQLIHIKNHVKADMNITAVSVEGEHITVNSPVKEVSGGFRIKTVLGPQNSLTPGEIKAKVIITTDFPQFNHFEIPVTANLQ